MSNQNILFVFIKLSPRRVKIVCGWGKSLLYKTVYRMIHTTPGVFYMNLRVLSWATEWKKGHCPFDFVSRPRRMTEKSLKQSIRILTWHLGTGQKRKRFCCFSRTERRTLQRDPFPAPCTASRLYPVAIICISCSIHCPVSVRSWAVGAGRLVCWRFERDRADSRTNSRVR